MITPQILFGRKCAMNAKPTDSFKARMEQIVAEAIANDQAKRAPKTNGEEWDEKIGRDRQERLLGVTIARP